MRRVHVIIIGDVHNVGFRSWTKSRAEKMGVRGWVKNNPDGTVEAVFEGEDGRVGEILDACRQGPSRSYVEKVEVREEKFRSEFERFDITF